MFYKSGSTTNFMAFIVWLSIFIKREKDTCNLVEWLMNYKFECDDSESRSMFLVSGMNR